MSASERTINVRRITHWESDISGDGFSVKFRAMNGDERFYTVRLHFDWWALPFLARELWRIVKRRRTTVEGELAAAEKALSDGAA